MITNDEALAAVDPSLPEEERLKRAQELVAGSAAYDAYLDSRSPLEQIMARAQGGGTIAAHADLNSAPEGTPGGEISTAQAAAPAAPAGVIDATAVDESAAEEAGESSGAEQAERDAELAAAKERVAELEAGKE